MLLLKRISGSISNLDNAINERETINTIDNNIVMAETQFNWGNDTFYGVKSPVLLGYQMYYELANCVMAQCFQLVLN